MSAFRRAAGALIGGAVTIAALRTRQIAAQRDASVLDVIGDMPVIFRNDFERLSDDVRSAISAGRTAAVAKEREVEETILHRKGTSDD